MHPLRFARERLPRVRHGQRQCTHSASLLVTSDAAKCARYNALAPEWACVLLPSPMRIYHGGTRPNNAEQATVWSIGQYDQVLIEDLTIDVLPHPKLGEFEELDADAALSDDERLEWLLPNHVNEFNGGSLRQPRRQVQLVRPGRGGGLTSTDKWKNLKNALPLAKRLEPAGAVFEVHDVEHLTIQRVNIRGLTMETMLQLRAARDLTSWPTTWRGSAPTVSRRSGCRWTTARSACRRCSRPTSPITTSPSPTSS